MNYSHRYGDNHSRWDADPEHIQNKKKIVSDLMALRRMKLMQSAQIRSPTSLSLELPRTISPSVSVIEAVDVQSVLEGTLLKDELDTRYGKASLKKATEHFAKLAVNFNRPSSAEESEIKRRHFLNDITHKRKDELETARKNRQHRQQQLLDKQIELKSQSPTLKDDLQGPSNVSQLVTETEQNIKAMEHNLRYLKMKYGTQVTKSKLQLQRSLSFERFKKSHKQQVKIAHWIIDDIILENVYNISKGGKSDDSKLLQTMLMADHQQWEDHQLRKTKYEATLIILDEIVSEVCHVMLENICKECLHLNQMCVVISEDIIINSVNNVVPKSKLTTKIIDETWCGIKLTRERTHKGTWAHTQASFKEHQPELKPAPQAPKKVEPVPVPVIEDHDAETISSETTIPKIASQFGNLKEMHDYANNETALWSHMTADSTEFSYSTKPTLGISVSALNCDHSYLALGAQRGDITVYNMLWQPSKLVRCVAFFNKTSDPIIQIKWSFDSCRLLTLSESGCLIVWSLVYAPYASRSDLNHLEIIQPQDSVMCQQLTALCILEARKGDFLFQEGPLAENEKVISPITMCFFDNSLSSAASQDHILATLANGDILRCDLTQVLQQRCVDSLMSGITHNFKPLKHVLGNSNLKTEKVHKISQGITAELFRYHRTNIFEIIFVGNTGDMISLDSNLNLFHWKHNQENFNNFGWFVPFKKYKLSFEEEILTPRGEDEVVFEDHIALKKASKGRRVKGKHIVEQERKTALRQLGYITNQVPWHSDEFPHELDKNDKQKKPPKFFTRIYAPPNLIDTAAGGATFHVVMMKRDTNVLVKYFQRIYETATHKSVTLIQSVLDLTGNRLFFMLLFDEHLPKVRKHITIVDFDLNNFKFGKIGSIQIELKSDIFLKVQSGKACSFSISRVNEFTGSEYVLCNIGGSLHIYSLLSGRKVLHGTTEKTKLSSGNLPGLKLNPKMSKILPESKVLIVYPDGITMFVIIIPQTNIYLNTRLIRIGDKEGPELRHNILSSYKLLKNCEDKKNGVVGWYSPSQACHREAWTHRELPISVYNKMIIYKLLDISVARATGERMNQDVRKAVWQTDWIHMQDSFL